MSVRRDEILRPRRVALYRTRLIWASSRPNSALAQPLKFRLRRRQPEDQRQIDRHVPRDRRITTGHCVYRASSPTTSRTADVSRTVASAASHDNQSWLAALATVLDTSAVLLVVGEDALRHNAQLSFAMARHVAVDLSLVFWLPPTKPELQRLTSAEFGRLLAELGVSESERNVAAAESHLAELRELYEPFLASLSRYFLLPVSRFVPDKPTVDNWQTSAWTERTPAIGRLPVRPGDEHFA